MGGLSGGLYNLFDIVGMIFFTVLIGHQRASRPQLLDTRVRMGGFIVFFCIFAFVFPPLFLSEREAWFKYSYNEVHSVKFVFTMGLLAALGAGFFLGTLFIANMLIYYVQRIAWEAEQAKRKEEETLRKEKERQIKKKKHYAELLEKGVSPDEAEYEAEKFAATDHKSGCFIATAVYGDHGAPEVVFLRKWRDNVLLNHIGGNLTVKAYYFCSPHFVPVVHRSRLLKKVIRIGLDGLVKRIKRDSRGRQNRC